jgi:RNA polymerase sigma-70 factor, ECF subfamily
MDAALGSAAARVDEDIATLLRSGDRERAFAAVLEHYEGKIYRLCCVLLRDHAQAQDAAQESLVRIWKAIGSYDSTAASVSTWVYAIARNRCLTALERRRQLESLSEDTVAEEVAGIMATEPTDGDERNEQLRELVALLPERLRRVVTLYYYEDRSIEEVARMLGCPEGTVKTHLFRARAQLGEQLRRRGLDDPDLWLERAS